MTGVPITESCVAGVYTPAFVERYLSRSRFDRNARGVAGVYTPAFVERQRMFSCLRGGVTRVAGVYTPAFVERAACSLAGKAAGQVSPEFILRPSLSVQYVKQLVVAILRVSPEFILRPSLSVQNAVSSVSSCR